MVDAMDQILQSMKIPERIRAENLTDIKKEAIPQEVLPKDPPHPFLHHRRAYQKVFGVGKKAGGFLFKEMSHKL